MSTSTLTGSAYSSMNLEQVVAKDISLADEGLIPFPFISPVWGGSNGMPFGGNPQIIHQLTKVILRGDKIVNSIQADIETKDGKRMLGIVHGGSSGTPVSLELQAGEYFTLIQGQLNKCVSYLELYTNLKRRLAAGCPILYAECKLRVPGSSSVVVLGR